MRGECDTPNHDEVDVTLDELLEDGSIVGNPHDRRIAAPARADLCERDCGRTDTFQAFGSRFLQRIGDERCVDSKTLPGRR